MKIQKLIFVNHCSNVTGSLTDIQAVNEIAKNNNLICVVDASQSAGVIPIECLLKLTLIC